MSCMANATSAAGAAVGWVSEQLYDFVFTGLNCRVQFLLTLFDLLNEEMTTMHDGLGFLCCRQGAPVGGLFTAATEHHLRIPFRTIMTRDFEVMACKDYVRVRVLRPDGSLVSDELIWETRN